MPRTYYNINAASAQASKSAIKPLSNTQMKGMTQAQFNKWLKQQKAVSKLNRRNLRASSKTVRRNIKAVAKQETALQRLKHQTIRQGMAEVSAVASQAFSPLTASGISKAIEQNTAGGVTTVTTTPSGDTNTTITEQGPVMRHSQSGREED